MEQITPFRIEIPQADLDDLYRRLDQTRYSNHCFDGEGGWSRGVPTAYIKELADYWRHRYDWRAAEAELNSFPQFTTEIDGATIHFLHVRSPEPDAIPMIITHGFPDSFVQFLDLIGPLTDPRSHGGDPSQAFHLVIPSIPGFGYSQPTGAAPWPFPRVADAWIELMARLGYDRYVTQGADLGMWISLLQAGRDAEHVRGAHLNFLITPPTDDPADMASLTADEAAIMGKLLYFDTHLSGFTKIQTTRPQTLGAGLVDSPVGQLAWIVEKFFDWTDSAKAPEDAVDRDRMLTNVMLYWLTGSGMTAAHFYCDNAQLLPARPPIAQPPAVSCPLAVAAFPADPGGGVRRFAERLYPDIVRWTEYDRGGHFPAMEVPELMIEDIRAFATVLRGRC
jgi:microsomal epoxide hydrolase